MSRMTVEHIGGGQYMIGNHPIYTDWDYPTAASWLGWSIRRVQRKGSRVVHLSRYSKIGCRHQGTDGTITCPDCGLTASDFINAAREYLDRFAV